MKAIYVVVAVLGAWTCALLLEATVAPVRACDEILWLARSRVSPIVVSGDPRAWAMDIPAVGRGIHFLVLSATGATKSGNDVRCWQERGGTFYCMGKETEVRRTRSNPLPTIADVEAWHGTYFNLDAILTMRYSNVVVFMAGVVFLLATSLRLMGRGRVLPALATVLPFALTPLFATDVVFVTWSGEVVLFSATAAFLWTIVRLDTSTICRTAWIAAAAVAAGLATAAKLNGVFCLLILVIYLAATSRGWARVWDPVAASAVAGIVFVAANPIYLLNPPWAWLGIAGEMVTRRTLILAAQAGRAGAMSWTLRLHWFEPYVALVPVEAVLAWRARHDLGYRVVALWGTVLWLATATGILRLAMPEARYFAPLELGLVFSMAALALRRGPRE